MWTVTKRLQWLLFWWMFAKAERVVFVEAIHAVKQDVTVPIYGKDQYRHGREARRDVATELLQVRMPHLRDREIHLGLELAVALTA
jgi:hypothetical protein